MIPEVKYDEHQLREMNRRLERFASHMADATPANREASIALYGWTIRNFDNEGRLHGGWAPLAPSTVKQKQRIGKEKMLVRSGSLRANFTQFYSKDNAGVGNQIKHAAYHHYGVPSRNLPRRELLPRRDKVLEIGLKVYGAYVARQVREANRGV